MFKTAVHVRSCAGAKAARIWTRYAVVRMLPPVAVCLAIWFISPPETLTSTAMHMLAVFVAVILSFLTAPYPMSVTVRAWHARMPRHCPVS